MKLNALLLVLLVPLSNVARAEGGSCPNGYYPIGGGGVSGCAPIPGYNNGSSSTPDDAPRSSARSTPMVWETRYGAIATEKNGAGFGVVAHYKTEQQAQLEALSQCQATITDPKGKCEVRISYHNQCAAYAWGAGWSEAARAVDLATAEALALDGCKEAAKETCKIYYSDCSFAEAVPQ